MQDPRFPRLSPSQINILKQFGREEQYDRETTLFKRGDLEYDFFAVVEGTIVIKDLDTDQVIVEHTDGEFSGDHGMLSQRSAEFHAFAKAGTTCIRIIPLELRRAISRHSDLSDLLLNAFLLRQETMLNEITGGIKLLGSDNESKTYQLRDFLEKNHIWYNFLNVDRSDEAMDLLNSFNLDKSDLPIVISTDLKVCKHPTIEQLATVTGVLTDFDDRIFDVTVVGAGPAGLAASVYAASEGLQVVTIDSQAPGGQAGKSSKIENYLGFPTGISGTELARRAYIQAQKFGCMISIPQTARNITHVNDCFTLQLANDQKINTRTIIAATGADYHKLPLDNIETFEGKGVYYSATGMHLESCYDQLVGVVGGGNSAGQAALFIAEKAKEVFVILRGGDLGAKMSDYLVQRIEAADNITVLLHTEVTELIGNAHLEKVELTHQSEGKNRKPITHLFTFIGAYPCTDWLKNLVVTDDKGFICTGDSISEKDLKVCRIYKSRNPQSFETSIPGCFAVGDVRKGSVKRVASAVGEGSMVVSQIHTHLGGLNDQSM